VLKEKLAATVAFLRATIGAQVCPEIFVVLGSGFKDFLSEVASSAVLPLHEIPHVQGPTVAGHGSSLAFGKIQGREVAVADGRMHLYEGYTADEVVHLVRAMGLLGVRKLLLTNAAGGLNRGVKPGDVVALADHLNLMGTNCLLGAANDLGPRFVDLTNCYDRPWREALVAAENLKTGVYAGCLGPTYETPAETRMLGALGADLAGMSTVQEAIAARQMGMRVAGLSLVTNWAAGLSDNVDHQEVLQMGKQRAPYLKKLLTKAIALS